MTKRIFDLFSRSEPEAPPEETLAGEPSAAEEVISEAEEALENASVSDDAKLRNDIAELLELFPKLTAGAIPEWVWQRVQQGDSLCAAFCLWMVRRAKEEKRIRTVNDRVMKSAPPQLAERRESADYFTRDTVKNMSPEQIRGNLDVILRSMDSWK